MTSRVSELTRAAVVCVWLTLMLGASADAQTSLDIPLQFDFVNPGAKSLALGGAFAGVADDATASFANPAGLTLLVTRELSGEVRLSRTKTLALQGGRLSGIITNEGVDTIQGPDFGESAGWRLGAHYASVVYPHPSHRWVIAGYRHELARVNQGTDRERISSNGVFQQDPSEVGVRRELPYSAGRALTITGYGASGAYKLRRNVSIGAGLAVYAFSLASEVDRLEVDGFPYGSPNYDVDSVTQLAQQGSAVGVAPTLGLTIDRGRARVGVVYRRGASFDFTTQDGSDPPRDATFRVPHTLALGVSVRATPRLLVSAEVTRIEYSRLVDDFVTDQARATGQQASFVIDNGTELHLGAQYARGRQRGAPLRLRVGAWYDPDHSVHFRAARTPISVADRLFDERFGTALSKGESQTHLAGGVGLTLTPRLEFNAGLDIAKRSRQFSTSVIVHFGQEVR